MRAVAEAARRRRPRGGGGRPRHGARRRRSRARPAISTACSDFRGVDAYGYLPPDKVVALCTGSQGEPRAALARIAEDQHPEVTLRKGDRVIFSSRTIPGNEKAVGKRHQRAGAARASRSSPTAPIWCMSPAIRAAPRWRSMYRLGAAAHRRFRCMARRCICPSTPSSRARPASARSCCAATAIWCGLRPAGRRDRRSAGRRGSTRTARC